ncbi:hypothetical protein [Allomuricauda sp. d1]|uniref:hypothetical protein n=1 Tax=Allomuricauda sp. d1 TaxID=3136725 RepID=UPI0031E3703B
MGKLAFHIYLVFSPILFSTLYCQELEETSNRGIEFSGSINLNTNGISPVPAFSLDKPSVIGIFSLKRKRFGFTPEMAFSTKAKPWFINPRITYEMIDGEKFGFSLSALYSFNFTYPEELIGNTLQSTTVVEHYALLQSNSIYSISAKLSIGLTTFHGLGLQNASIQRGNFFILAANITKLKITENLYHSLFPQLVYVDLDGDSQGLFVSTIYGIGHKKWPFFLSTQLTHAAATNISPNPGFKWNVGLTYHF